MNKTLNSIYELAKKEMESITAEEWSAAVRLAKKQEDLYAEVDQLDQLDPLLEPNDEPAIDEAIKDDEPEESTEMSKCEHCEFESNNASSFTNHSNSVKKCDHCSKIFCGPRSIRNLKSHQKEHKFKPNKAHTCIHCKKAFQYPSLLKKHMVWSKCGRL